MLGILEQSNFSLDRYLSRNYRSPPEGHFNYRSNLKIVGPIMYESVSDGCVTIVNPKYSNRNRKPHINNNRSNADEESTNTNIQNVQTPLDNRTSRRHKLLTRQQNPQVDCIRSKRNMTTNNCDKMRTDDSNVDSFNVAVEQITLENERNYKNRFQTVGVQTSSILPYRLRFWPKLSADFKCDPSGNSSIKDKLKCCGRIIGQWIFSQIGLTIILVNWALLGATAFYNTEGPRESQQSIDVDSLQKELVLDLATDLRQVSEFSQAWPQTIHKYMDQHETLLLEAVSAGYGEGGGGNIWTYPGCVLFTVSLLTTLGFGAPVPRTVLGRGAAVLLGAIGIPLHFLLMINIGNLAAGKLYQLFNRTLQTNTPKQPESPTRQSRLLSWFPILAICLYYTLGAVLFGIVRQRSIVDTLLFPLDFTAAGGVAKTLGHVRICYALYLEVAVILAATIVSLMQASATKGIVDLGLKLGLLTNT